MKLLVPKDRIARYTLNIERMLHEFMDVRFIQPYIDIRTNTMKTHNGVRLHREYDEKTGIVHPFEPPITPVPLYVFRLATEYDEEINRKLKIAKGVRKMYLKEYELEQRAKYIEYAMELITTERGIQRYLPDEFLLSSRPDNEE